MGTKKQQVFKCELCGNIVEAIHEGGGTLGCCGENMKAFEENSVDAAKEKHVPVVEKTEGGYKVKVGDVAHPMGDDHYIEWIELIAGGKSYREFLEPGSVPEATFLVDATEISVRAYCNLHGLWKS